MSTLNNTDLIFNKELSEYYMHIGLIKSINDFNNIEITYLYQDFFYPSNIENLIKSFINNKNINFLIIPIGIILDIGAHANILIYNKLKDTLERFEPNGSDAPPNFNYNAKLLDNNLYNYFIKYFPNMTYLKPKDFLPKIGFQTYENIEFYKTRKLGDPGGFCVAWCLWYANHRIKYPEVDAKEIVKIILVKIKYNNFSFKNIIRNFSKTICDYRDSLLESIKLDINLYINDQISPKQIKDLESSVLKLI